MQATSLKKSYIWNISIPFLCIKQRFSSRIRSVAYVFRLLMNGQRMRDRMTKLFCYLTTIVTCGYKFNAENTDFNGKTMNLSCHYLIP